MMNKVIVLMISIFCLGCGTKSAYAMSMDLGCPTSVRVGATLNVKVKNIQNWGPELTLSRYMTGIVANTSTNTIGGAGFYGPFARTLATAKVVPAPTQTPYYAPGTISNFSVPVVATTPDVAGKMAVVFLNFITADGEAFADGSCLVSVLPAL